jgi:hypothetical protein
MTPAEKRKATLEAKKKRMAAQAKVERDKVKALKTVEKLERLASNHAATSAEAANAREKMEAIQAKADAMTTRPRLATDLPKTAEEMLARRKTPRREWTKQPDNKTETKPTGAEWCFAEIDRLRARVAELEAILAARDNEMKRNGEAKPKNKGGRPCHGDRPMTGYERLKAWRERRREARAE